MSLTRIGEVEELTPDMVERTAISRLKLILESPPEPILFDCIACGEERAYNCPDPGILMIKPFRCIDVQLACKKPPRPRATRRHIYFRPGSLVFAQKNPQSPHLWPGIIEDPPYGNERYIVHGKTPDNPTAYWVTFVHSKDKDARWFGGFIRRSDIRPLELPGNVSDYSRMPHWYRRAVFRVADCLLTSLKDRLIKFSFVAWAASQRQISLEVFGGSSWQMTGDKRKDEGGASTSSAAPTKQQKTQREAPEPMQEVGKSKRSRGILSVFKSLKAGPPTDMELESESDSD